MPISWPPSLPAPKVDGFSRKQRTNRVETTTAQGLKRARQRFTGKVWDVLVSLPPLTATQLETFNTFYETTTSSGTLEFDWYDYTLATPAAATFKFGDSPPDVVAIAAKTSTEDSLWRVSFSLEQRS